jgi:hypothetical protein
MYRWTLDRGPRFPTTRASRRGQWAVDSGQELELKTTTTTPKNQLARSSEPEAPEHLNSDRGSSSRCTDRPNDLLAAVWSQSIVRVVGVVVERRPLAVLRSAVSCVAAVAALFQAVIELCPLAKWI